MKSLKVASLTLIGCVLLAAHGQAQNSSSALTLGLFDRYLEALRQEFGVPSLSAVVIEDGRIWERAYGLADIGANVAATPATPYPITGLTETIGAAMVINQCVDSGRGTLNDRVMRWTPFAEPSTTIGHLLTHVLPTGVYQYDPGRFSTLGEVAAECVQGEFDRVLAARVLDSLAMVDSVPGRDAIEPSRRDRFTSAQLSRYDSALRKMALPYRLDSKHAATRSEYSTPGITAATGLIASVRDLVQFDAALNDGFISRESLAVSWNAAPGRPTGLGWFVQTYSNQRVVWQFGIATDAYSSIIVKIPDRRLTLILLANSDSLTNAVNPQAPDVTQSVFARTFLRLFIS